MSGHAMLPGRSMPPWACSVQPATGRREARGSRRRRGRPGPAWVGAVGDESHTEHGLGDNVNITARLASAAGAGEVLVTVEAARVAGMDVTGLEHRSLELKGREQPADVVSLTVASS